MRPSDPSRLHPDTRAVHVGQPRDPATGAVVPPLHLASTFVQPGAGEWGPYDYSRSGNPTRDALQEVVASLEGGCGALAFPTGMAATHCVLGLLSAGDHVVAGRDIYGGTYRILHKIADRAGIGVTLVDTTDPDTIAPAVTDRTRLLWLESPGNPLMSVTDLARCAEIGHAHDLLVAVDATIATPVLTRPLELGLDVVMHSATKYFGGHSDLMGGLLVTREPELLEKLYFVQNATGAVLSPFDCFLCSRGVKTMALRVRRSCESAMAVATWLADHPQVGRVNYPGLPTHPGHDIARRQMDGGFGGVLSFELAAGFDAAKAFVGATELFQLAVSFGAVESLISQPAAMSHASYAPEDRAKHGIGDGLIRLSVGVEHAGDLLADLHQAMPTG